MVHEDLSELDLGTPICCDLGSKSMGTPEKLSKSPDLWVLLLPLHLGERSQRALPTVAGPGGGLQLQV